MHSLEIRNVLREALDVGARAARAAVPALVVQHDAVPPLVQKARQLAEPVEVVVEPVQHDHAAARGARAQGHHAQARPVLGLHNLFCRLQCFLPCAAALTAALVAGCTPHRHADRFYEMDPAQLLALEQRAAAQCQTTRPDGRLPPHPFTTDGCSAWPDHTWSDCCVEHDIIYWCGGNAELRRRADGGLRDCVAQRGHPSVAEVMHFGVRLGGAPWLPFSWRWGYGWDWPYRYDD